MHTIVSTSRIENELEAQRQAALHETLLKSQTISEPSFQGKDQT